MWNGDLGPLLKVYIYKYEATLAGSQGGRVNVKTISRSYVWTHFKTYSTAASSNLKKKHIEITPGNLWTYKTSRTISSSGLRACLGITYILQAQMCIKMTTELRKVKPQKPEISTAVFLHQYFIRQLFTLKTFPDICLNKCPKIILLPLCYPKKKFTKII